MSNTRNNTNDLTTSTDPIYNQGVIYSDGLTSDGLPNGNVGDVLTSTGTSTFPVWAPSSSFPGAEGLIYNNTLSTTTTIPTSSNVGYVLTSNGTNPVYQSLPVIPAYEIQTVIADIRDSVDLSILYFSVPLLFCRIGDMVTFKINAGIVNYVASDTMNDDQSYFEYMANVPVTMTPSSLQIDSFSYGHNNNWNNTGGIMHLTSSGLLSFRSAQNTGDFGGFGVQGQTMNITDQSFTYFLNN
jgi:hypothetical protein